MGAVQSLAVGVTENGALARGLIRFDLSNALPAGAIISSVVLTLPVVRASFLVEPSTFAVHRMIVSWAEGDKGVGTLTDSGSTATAGESSWINRFQPDIFWNDIGGAPGADYAQELSASAAIAGTSPIILSSTPKLISDVQSWLDQPSANWGWLIKDQFEPSAQTARRLGSREHPGSKPQLTIEYSVPGILRISNARLQGTEFCLTFEAQAGQRYVIESRATANAGNWSTVATIPPPSTTGPVDVCDPLGIGARFYRVVQP
jgi:hypothetical protein